MGNESRDMVAVKGFEIRKRWLDAAAQAQLAGELAAVVRAAPFFQPLTPWGKPMSVRMTSAGRYGWFTDARGYRYIDRHPSGAPWPPIPETALEAWRALVSEARMPDCCLVNHYGAKARMGLHRDADEADFAWPVLSISLGDPGLFRMGGPRALRPHRLDPAGVRRRGGHGRRRRASPTTASTASASAPHGCCPRADGST